MFQRGERVILLDWVMGDGETRDAVGTVLYSYSIWNAPTMRSDSYSGIEHRQHGRCVVQWDDGLMTHMEKATSLGRLLDYSEPV